MNQLPFMGAESNMSNSQGNTPIQVGSEEGCAILKGILDGTNEQGSTTEPPKVIPKTKKKKEAHGEILDMIEGVSSPQEAYSKPEVISYLSNLTSATKINALKKLRKIIPVKWDNVVTSLIAFVDSDLNDAPGGIVAALNDLKKKRRSITPEQAAEELVANPLLPHLWNLLGSSLDPNATLDDMEDEIFNLEVQQAIKGKTAKREPGDTGGFKLQDAPARVKRRGPRILTPEEKEAKKLSYMKKNKASEEAEKIVTQASSEEETKEVSKVSSKEKTEPKSNKADPAPGDIHNESAINDAAGNIEKVDFLKQTPE